MDRRRVYSIGLGYIDRVKHPHRVKNGMRDMYLEVLSGNLYALRIGLCRELYSRAAEGSGLSSCELEDTQED